MVQDYAVFPPYLQPRKLPRRGFLAPALASPPGGPSAARLGYTGRGADNSLFNDHGCVVSPNGTPGMKRLIICCDGSWDAARARYPTHAAHMARGLLPSTPDHIAQIVFYTGCDHLPAGSPGPPVIRTLLDRAILDSYRFLVHNYVAGDEIYFFGVGRGAYVARSCIGLLRNAWLLRKEHGELIPAAYHIYRTLWGADADNAIHFRGPHCQAVRVKFLGVWDTLGPRGIPTGLATGDSGERHGFHDATLSGIVDNAYQALAIDQRGAPLLPAIWHTRPGRTRTEQCWFAGDHHDIGGGHRQGALAALTLRWMTEKATACGLMLDPLYLDGIYASLGAADPALRVHNSSVGGLRGRSAELRTIGVTNHDETLHTSAEQRFLNSTDYRPANLQAFMKRDEQIRLPL